MNTRTLAVGLAAAMTAAVAALGCSDDENGGSSSSSGGNGSSSGSSSGEVTSSSSGGTSSSSGGASSSSGGTSSSSSSSSSGSTSSSGGPSACTTITVGEWDLDDNGPEEGGYIAFSGTPAPELSEIAVAYAGINGNDDAGEYNLSAPAQIDVCEHCVSLLVDTKTYLPNSGTMTVTAVDVVSGTATLTLANVELAEFDVAEDGSTSPVVGAPCYVIENSTIDYNP